MRFTSLFRGSITPPAPVPEPVPEPEQGAGSLTLADVWILQVPLTWHEAVGLVLEFLDGLGPNASLPDPAHIVLSPYGELRRFSAATVPGAPVTRAAALIEQLIGGSTAPAALRDLISQNSGEQPTHTSLPEFARALAYFERPNRRADVAAIYTRGQHLFEKASADRELERLRTKATTDQAPKPKAGRAGTPSRSGSVLHGVLVAALCVVIAVSSAALVWIAIAPAPPRAAALPASALGASPTQPPAAATAGGPASTVQAAAGEVMRLIGRSVAALGVSASSAKPVAPVASQSPDTTRGTGRPRAQSSANVSPQPVSAVAPARERRGQWSVSVQEVTSPIGLAEFVTVAADRSDEELLPIYSRTDLDVDPAVLVRPQMPSVPDGLAPQEEPSEFDLLIDQSGRVEQVRLVSPTNRFNDRFLVSAAKAWQFQPASRDGQPVRYRLRVRITP